MSVNKQEVIGKKFNNLTVESLHHIHPTTYHKYYKCVCDCGNSSIVNISFKGRTQTISEWAREIGIHHSSLVKRLKKWSLKEALTIKKYEV